MSLFVDCPAPHPSGGPAVPGVPWFDPFQSYLPPSNFHKPENPRKDNRK